METEANIRRFRPRPDAPTRVSWPCLGSFPPPGCSPRSARPTPGQATSI